VGPPTNGTGGTPVAPGTGQKAPTPRKHYRRWRPYERPVHALIVKPLAERVADLLGSMLLAAVVATIVTLATAAVTAALSWQVRPEVFAFFLLVSIAGAWAVLVPAKFWEGTDGDGVIRRLVMMTLGVALGAFAWGSMTWFGIDLGQLERFPEYHYNVVSNHHGLGYCPLSSCLVALGTLMLLVRWWLQADPLRRVRMSLWPMCASMVAAFLAALVWQAYGWTLVAIAGIMSVSIQIASPWINPRLRKANPEE